MADDLWIIVPKWGKFQHYTKRNPTWIKVYTELSSDPNWEALTLAQRGMLVTIWIEYAQSRGQVRTEHVLSKCGAGRKHVHLTSLNHAGFIEFSASKPLAHTRARERGTTYPQEEATPNASENGVVASSEKDLPRDPDAIARINALRDDLFGGDARG